MTVIDGETNIRVGKLNLVDLAGSERARVFLEKKKNH
jgi:hypothetical protein